MKANISKIPFCLLCLLVVSTASPAAVTIVHSVSNSGIRQSPSYRSQSTILLPVGGITDRLKSEMLSDPDAVTQGTAAGDIQSVGGGITTLLAALIGFFCITLVRDRRVWAALVYMIVIHPVIFETQRLDRLMRNVCFDKYFAGSVDRALPYNAGLAASAFDNKDSWAGQTTSSYRPAVGASEHIQMLPAIISAGLYPDEGTARYDAPVFSTAHVHGVFFTPDILSRPPPIAG